ncbi:effector-associated domain EAD1-containing protein [Kitasatospora cheerisanensis]|uniref:Effector-associated domain-containing protein n=1 Tax=Kitasatospora cheerisanensis KCTC 2395 TaxID=1348663 RepID=A0A066YKR0_9ACTN|nr:effector-associated domain EAD1-containing protein [Kitasatospora cheerisanensis]KDN82068.1 hypothetical protein KCH_62220 [Kitasatospora cheerisanensis KCTC 2395]
MAMSGRDLKKASEAFQDAFDLNSFDQMLRFHLSRKREGISLGASLAVVVFEVLDTADREGWIQELIAGARESNPGNPQLAEFAEGFGLAPVGRERRDALQRVLGA